MKYIMFALILFLSRPVLANNSSIFLVEDVAGRYTATAFELYTMHGQVTMTNAHVCEDHITLLAHLENPTRTKILIVKKVYKKHDLCELTAIPGVAPLFLAGDYIKGEPVTVEGFPLGRHAFTAGYIGKYERINRESLVVQYTGAVDFGSSGSPVLNRYGRVVGIINVKDGLGQGGMVPLENIKDFLDN